MELIDRVIANSWLVKLTKAFRIAHQYLIGDEKTLKNAIGIQSELLERKSQVMAQGGYETYSPGDWASSMRGGALALGATMTQWMVGTSSLIGNDKCGFEIRGQLNFGKYIVFLGSDVFVNDSVYPDRP